MSYSFRKAEGVSLTLLGDVELLACIFKQINVILIKAFLLFFEPFSPSYILHCLFSRPFCIYSPLFLSLFVFCTWVSVHSEGQVDPVSNSEALAYLPHFTHRFILSFFLDFFAVRMASHCCCLQGKSRNCTPQLL